MRSKWLWFSAAVLAVGVIGVGSASAASKPVVVKGKASCFFPTAIAAGKTANTTPGIQTTYAAGLHMWWRVQFPNGKVLVLQQLGNFPNPKNLPASAKGRVLNISAQSARDAGYSNPCATSQVTDKIVTATLIGPKPTSGTPAKPTAPPKAPKPTPANPYPNLKGKTIVIDPGHNGQNGNPKYLSAVNAHVFNGVTNDETCDTTGTETNSGYHEYDFTMAVANDLSDLITKAGGKVELTRVDSLGYGPCITRRAAFGNQFKSANAVAISIHADGAADNVRGFHIIAPALVTGKNDGIQTPSLRLGKDMAAEYGNTTKMPPATYVNPTVAVPGLGNKKAIVVRDDLAGLNLSTIPKVFIESGNMRNSTDAALLTSDSYQKKEAQSLAAGFNDYFGGK